MLLRNTYIEHRCPSALLFAQSAGSGSLTDALTGGKASANLQTHRYAMCATLPVR
jgi:hypothetical protein